MSFNIGNGYVTAKILPEQLDNIKKNSLPPEMSWWEKIKDFFCSTRQGDALRCLHRLCHHEIFQMSEQEIKETFIQLKYLAASGCRNKFRIDSNRDNDLYKIDGEIILSIPKFKDNSKVNQNKNDWRDCNDDDDHWRDCADDSDSEDSDVENIIGHPALRGATVQGQDILQDERYMKIINNLLVRVNEEAKKVGLWKRVKIAASVNVFTLQTLSKKIEANIRSDDFNLEKLKADITKLLEMEGVMNLIPQDVIENPDFIFMKNYSAQSH